MSSHLQLLHSHTNVIYYVYIYIAIQSASSNVSAHNKKILTTSFGGSTTSEGYSGMTLEKSRDKAETLGMQLCDGCLESVQQNDGWNIGMKHYYQLLELTLLYGTRYWLQNTLVDLAVHGQSIKFCLPIFTVVDFFLATIQLHNIISIYKNCFRNLFYIVIRAGAVLKSFHKIHFRTVTLI